MKATKTNTSTNQSIAQVFTQWMDEVNCDFNTAVSLTFEQAPRDSQHASSEFRYFLNKLNDSCFGNNWSRRANRNPANRLAVIPVIEDGFGRKRLHYHCVFAKPKYMSVRLFRLQIDLHWGATKYGGSTRNDVQSLYDKFGFVDYMTKELKVMDFEKLDVSNLHIY